MTHQSQVLTLAWSLTILLTIQDLEVVRGAIALVVARPIGRVKTESLHNPVKTLLTTVAISLPWTIIRNTRKSQGRPQN